MVISILSRQCAVVVSIDDIDGHLYSYMNGLGLSYLFDCFEFADYMFDGGFDLLCDVWY